MERTKLQESIYEGFRFGVSQAIWHCDMIEKYNAHMTSEGALYYLRSATESLNHAAQLIRIGQAKKVLQSLSE